jgi:hypothetical protein
MAILLILLSLFALVGFGTGSSTTSATATEGESATVTQGSQTVIGSRHSTASACVVVTWRLGERTHRRPCGRAPAKKP